MAKRSPRRAAGESKVKSDGGSNGKLNGEPMPAPLPQNELEGNEERSPRKTSDSHPKYVDRRRKESPKLKGDLSRYVVNNFIDKDTHVLQLSSGTQVSFLMDEIIKRHTSHASMEDLIILTTNLEVLEKGRAAKIDKPQLFDSMEIVLTGGSLHESLRSLVGPIGARLVKNDAFQPDTVVLGVKAIEFGDAGKVTLRYHFGEQLATQEAYATRSTRNRIIVFDHTKIGIGSGFSIELDIDRFAKEAQHCLFVSSWPTDSVEQAKVLPHIKSFEEMISHAEPDTRAKVRFVLVDKHGAEEEFEQLLKRSRAKAPRRPVAIVARLPKTRRIVVEQRPPVARTTRSSAPRGRKRV